MTTPTSESVAAAPVATTPISKTSISKAPVAEEVDAQAVVAPNTSSAIFLVLTLTEAPDVRARVRGVLADVAALVRSIDSRAGTGGGDLSCVLGVGSAAWDVLFDGPRPALLHPFHEVRGEKHTAPSTPGDLLLHIRSSRLDTCFELTAQLMKRFGAAVSVVDETQGFFYFGDRDLIGFVDGTENPTGAQAVDATILGDEDPDFAGGSYVIVQKYLHDLAGWNALPVETQEKIVGREKLSNIELGDDVKPSYAHNNLTVIEQGGEEVSIVRHNMPFGRPSLGEFGTYFIGYARSPRVTERMLRNMFIGDPLGNYDRLLDYSTALTGGLFFVPSAAFLDELA